MTDTLKKLAQITGQIVQERDWDNFHGIQNLIMNLVRESTELLEPFTWLSPQEAEQRLKGPKKQEVEDELADVLFTVFMISNKANIDLEKIFLHKVKKIKEKYPVEKCKGRNLKYNEL